MDTREPVASLIIPTYRREAPLRQTLACVELIQTPDVQVIVVDQTPDHEPETEHVLRDMEQRGRIRRILLKRPGLLWSRNVGLSLTRAPIVVFIDDDVAFAPDFVAAHLAAFTDPQVQGSAGRVHLRVFGLEPSLPPKPPSVTSREWFDRPMPLASIATVRGCNMAFRRSALVQVGGFDPAYRIYVDDDDLAFAVRNFCGRITFNPSAWVIHYQTQGGTRAQKQPLHARPDFYHDYVYFMLKNTNISTSARVFAHLYRDSIIRQSLRSGSLKEIGRYHLALITGIVWGTQTWIAHGRVRHRLLIPGMTVLQCVGSEPNKNRIAL